MNTISRRSFLQLSFAAVGLPVIDSLNKIAIFKEVEKALRFAMKTQKDANKNCPITLNSKVFKDLNLDEHSIWIAEDYLEKKYHLKNLSFGIDDYIVDRDINKRDFTIKSMIDKILLST